MSSLTGSFDIVYLGIFIILSPAFNSRFFNTKCQPILAEELAYAVSKFHSLLHVFSKQFIIILEGELIVQSYVVDQLLGEFAAAAVTFAMAISGSINDDENLGGGLMLCMAVWGYKFVYLFVASAFHKQITWVFFLAYSFFFFFFLYSQFSTI